MLVSKDYLEKKVRDLNEWIATYERSGHPELPEKKQNRAYYVSKLVEIDEYNLTHIKV